MNCFYSFNNTSSDPVGISCGIGAAIFQPPFPATVYGGDGYTDRGATVRNAVAKLMDGLGFVLTCQAEVIISSVHRYVFGDNGSKRVADGIVGSFVAGGA